MSVFDGKALSLWLCGALHSAVQGPDTVFLLFTWIDHIQPKLHVRFRCLAAFFLFILDGKFLPNCSYHRKSRYQRIFLFTLSHVSPRLDHDKWNSCVHLFNFKEFWKILSKWLCKLTYPSVVLPVPTSLCFHRLFVLLSLSSSLSLLLLWHFPGY